MEEHATIRQTLSMDYDSSTGQAQKGSDVEKFYPPLIETKIIKQFCHGKEHAFNHIYEVEGPQIWNFIRRYRLEQTLLEDAFQETWVNVWKYRQQLRDPKAYRRWLFRIASTTTISVIRKQNTEFKWRVQFEVDLGEMSIGGIADPEPNPRIKAIAEQDREVISRAIESMDSITQEIIALRMNTPLVLREIAENLNLPLGTVASKLRRAMIHIERAVETA